MRDTTIKDVLYALEYLGEQLCLRPSRTVGGKFTWLLDPSGRKVKQSVADQARGNPSVTSISTSIHGEQRFGWRSAA